MINMIEKIPNIIMQYMPSNVTSTFDTISGVGNLFTMLVVLGVAAGAIYVLLIMSSSIEKYRRFKKLFTNISKVFGYAAYGSLTIVVVGVPCIAGYWLFTTASNNVETTVNVLKPMGIIFCLFVGVTFLGYFTKNRIWKRIFSFHAEEKQVKNIKDNIDDISKVIE